MGVTPLPNPDPDSRLPYLIRVPVTLTHSRPAVVADALAEVQVGFPNAAIVVCQTRTLAAECTYRYLAAAHIWSVDSSDAATVFGAKAAPAGA